MTRRLVLVVIATIAAAIYVASLASGANAPIRVAAKLNAAQEVPRLRPLPVGTGRLTGTVVNNSAGGKLSWRLTFRHLSGKALYAHLQKGKRGTRGVAYLKLCGPCVSGAHGTARLSPGEVSLIFTGRAYVNVRTARRRAGEIRGQIVVVGPAPASR
jgi:hypothetical protein